jgi:hypothetical protein
MAKAADYDVTEECLDHYRMILSSTPRGAAFGNGRFARNLLEAAIGRHAWRLRDVAEPTLQQLRELIADDLDDEPAPSEPDTTCAELAPDSPPSPAAEPDQATSEPIPDSEETA